MDELKQQTIEFYSKLLKLPTFKHCNDIIQHLNDDSSYADFLIKLMKNEYDTRQAATRQRHIKAAHFPYLKTFDELDLHRFEHLDEAYLNELATCDFIKNVKHSHDRESRYRQNTSVYCTRHQGLQPGHEG